MRRLSTFQVFASVLVLVNVVLVGLIAGVAFDWFGVGSTPSQSNYASPDDLNIYPDDSINHSLPTHYKQTEAVLIQMETATYDALTAEAAATPTPHRINVATYQIPLTQLVVQENFQGTMAALDHLATGTAGAIQTAEANISESDRLHTAAAQDVIATATQQAIDQQRTIAPLQTVEALDMMAQATQRARSTADANATQAALNYQAAPAATRTAMFVEYRQTSDAWDMMVQATQHAWLTVTALAPTPDGVWVRAARGRVNVYASPGAAYDVAATIPNNVLYRVFGATPDQRWLLIEVAGSPVWVEAQDAYLLGDPATVPVVLPQSTPTPETSATPAN